MIVFGAILVLLLLAAFLGWYFDPTARRAAERTRQEMADGVGDPDNTANREWW